VYLYGAKNQGHDAQLAFDMLSTCLRPGFRPGLQLARILEWGLDSANSALLPCIDWITVWTVVQAVLTATFNSYGDRQISTPYKINTPEPIDKKFGTVDYVREGTLYIKFDTNPPTGGFWVNGWNITKIIFYLYLFFLRHAHRSDPWMDFYTR